MADAAAKPAELPAASEPIDALLEAARRRSKEVTLLGETLIVWEPSALANMEYRQRSRDGDKEGAVAVLIASCIKRTDGTPRFTKDQAVLVAGGRAEVMLPLIIEVTALAKPTDEKKNLVTKKLGFIASLWPTAARLRGNSSKG